MWLVFSALARNGVVPQARSSASWQPPPPFRPATPLLFPTNAFCVAPVVVVVVVVVVCMPPGFLWDSSKNSSLATCVPYDDDEMSAKLR